MCNAWHHSYDCDCGWGGPGHKGSSAGWGGSSYRPSGNYSSTPSYTNVFTTYHSYVNPNARCPVCREPVFFYQSPHGGKVFFDELGPPWPKHPCTDTNANVKPASLGTKNAPYSWQQNHWTPFLVKSFTVYLKKWVRIEGMLGDTKYRLVVYPSRKTFLSNAFPIHVQVHVGGICTLSSFRYDNRLQETTPITIRAGMIPPDMEGWLEHKTLKPFVLWFLSHTEFPTRPFDLKDKDRFGTSRWISDPSQFYMSVYQIIEKGEQSTSESEQVRLLKELKALKKLFDKKL